MSPEVVFELESFTAARLETRKCPFISVCGFHVHTDRIAGSKGLAAKSAYLVERSVNSLHVFPESPVVVKYLFAFLTRVNLIRMMNFPVVPERLLGVESFATVFTKLNTASMSLDVSVKILPRVCCELAPFRLADVQFGRVWVPVVIHLVSTKDLVG